MAGLDFLVTPIFSCFTCAELEAAETVTIARRPRLLAIDKPAFDHRFPRNPKAIERFAIDVRVELIRRAAPHVREAVGA